MTARRRALADVVVMVDALIVAPATVLLLLAADGEVAMSSRQVAVVLVLVVFGWLPMVALAGELLP